MSHVTNEIPRISEPVYHVEKPRPFIIPPPLYGNVIGSF